jgi:hypothetical protein
MGEVAMPPPPQKWARCGDLATDRPRRATTSTSSTRPPITRVWTLRRRGREGGASVSTSSYWRVLDKREAVPMRLARLRHTRGAVSVRPLEPRWRRRRVCDAVIVTDLEVRAALLAPLVVLALVLGIRRRRRGQGIEEPSTGGSGQHPQGWWWDEENGRWWPPE